MNICLVSANDIMEHFLFPGNIDFAADDLDDQKMLHDVIGGYMKHIFMKRLIYGASNFAAS